MDSSFSAYVTGNTTAPDFPTFATPPGVPFQTVNYSGIYLGTGFVTKFSPDGSSLVYSTYLGGNDGENVVTRGAAGAIALDSSGDAYLTGNTFSTNFPTKNPTIATCNSPCNDAFVSELNPTGTALVFSTFLGGTTASKDSVGLGIAVDSSDSIYVGGETSLTNFPVTSNAIQSSPGVGFITKFNPNGAGIAYSSYFSGYVTSIAVGSDDGVVLFGFDSTSLPFESTADAFPIPTCVGGPCDFDFLSKLKADGTLLFSTPIGANLECCGATGALDPAGNAYIAGSTGSLALPTTMGSFEPTLPSNYTGFTPFVAKIAFSSSSSPIQISPASLTSAGFPDESYIQNFTATGGSGAGYTWSISSGGTALTNLGLSLSSGGQLSGYPNATGTFPFTVEVVDSLNDTATQNYTLIVYPDISTTPTSLPAGVVGTPYSQALNGSGGAGGPYSFSVISGTALSAVGLTLSPAGLISGTPSTTETAAALLINVADSLGYHTELSYTLTVDSASSGPITINDPETVTVNDSLTEVQLVDVSDPETIAVTDIDVVTVTSPLTITGPSSLPAGTLNAAYTSTTISASGGSGVYTWSATGLPAGLSMSSGGVLSGKPTTNAGSPYSVTVKVTDSSSNTATKTYTLTISALPLAIAGPASLPAGELNVAYAATTFSASGGSGVYTWSATGLPAGLSMSPGGVLSGTPTVAGIFSVNVTVLDSSANTNSVIFSLTVASPSLGISASPNTLTIAQGKSGQITITFTPVGGYSGTVTLSCSGLPANTLCVFTLNGAAIKSYTFPGNNQPVSVVLTIETDVSVLAQTEPAPAPRRPGAIMTAIAFWCPGSLLGVIALRRKRKLFTKNPKTFGLCLFVLLVGAMAGLAGCISGGGFGTYVTPTGTSTVTVLVTPGSGSAQTLNIGVTVTQ